MRGRTGSRFPDIGFVRAMVRCSVLAAVVALATGSAFTRDPRFAVSFALAAAVDIGAMQVLVAKSDRSGPTAGAGPAFGVRLAAKALILGLAGALPAVFSLTGAAAGALVFDTTILVAGSVAAAHATFSAGTGPSSGGPHAREGGV